MVTPHSYYGYGCGAFPLLEDHRDKRMERIPGVAAKLEDLPPRGDLTPFCLGRYNQGSWPACTLYSLATLKSVQDTIESSGWFEFEAQEAHLALGGNARQGVATRPALSYAQTKGLRIKGQTRRHRIGTYAMAARGSAEAWIATLQAAVVARQPCVVVCRLPESFGWNSGTDPTEAYHSLCLVGYHEEGGELWLLFLNTWGPAFGQDGFVRLKASYLVANGFQRGDCYAYTVLDVLDSLDGETGVEPEPAPSPEPEPLPLLVTGYVGTTATIGCAAPGSLLTIAGDGFDAGVIRATWNGFDLPIEGREARLLSVRLPTECPTAAAPVIVRREGVTQEGPLLLVRGGALSPAGVGDEPPAMLSLPGARTLTIRTGPSETVLRIE